MTTIDDLKIIVSTLPEQPGVYQYFDVKGTIIYVGKAKNLKKRVSSYFTKNHDHVKTRILVSKIADIKHTVVDTEADALLLENNLIKKYRPRYNVLLKDDKTFPWIIIRNEEFPRLYYTRNFKDDGSKYFGPYTSGKMLHTVLDLIKQLYKFRSCSLILTETNIAKGKFKECLEYHIGNCKAPCIGLQTKEDYDRQIVLSQKILNGNIHSVIQYMTESMQQLAIEYKFEEAAILKEKIEFLKRFQAKSTIVNQDISNLDVFSIVDDAKAAYINFLRVIDGAIVQVYTMEMQKKLDESKEELLEMAIAEIKFRYNLMHEVLVPFDIELDMPGVKFNVPKIGDKRKLYELSLRNSMYYRDHRMKELEKVDPERHTKRILETMRKDLRMTEQPVHIECFDNSNLQGTNPVAACVVFTNAKPDKKMYRHFNVKTVEGPNDFASMEEIIFRRYKRMLDENQPLPQLIVIDGGKGQVSAAMNSLEKLELRGKITVIGIAKKLEEIYFPGDSVPLYLDKNSESLKIIQRIRDEAHRFGITFHKKKRELNFIQSELDDIVGIGDKTKEMLFRQFKSLPGIKDATLEELEKIVGNAKAKIIKMYFDKTV